MNKTPLGMIKLLTGPQVGNTFRLSSPTTMIGRDPEKNDIVLTDPSVSRIHTRIVNSGSNWSIEKIASHNIVTVNQHEVEQAAIHDNDIIGLGQNTTFLFRISTGVGPSSSDLYYQSFPAPSLSPTIIPQLGQEQLVTEQAPDPDSGSLFERSIPKLEVSSNVHPNKKSCPLTKQVINIGRHPSNDIIINENVVSAFHAQIVREANQLIFIHPHPQQSITTNGLLYQGRHIPGDKQYRKPLRPGDIFRIGDESGTLVTLTYNDDGGTLQEAIPEIHSIPLNAPSITIGRHPANTVILSHPQVSAHHARLEKTQNGYCIIDLGSTNHVYVNTQRETNKLLAPDDEIRIGPFKLTYTGTQLKQFDESNCIRIDALHLKKVANNQNALESILGKLHLKKVDDKQVILINDISLAIPPRKFVALVGGSGTGKSTLMDALNGLRPTQVGKVFYNGQDYYAALAAFNTQLGYVPQQDIVHQDITVDRALYYAAKLRLPGDYTKVQIKQRIDEVLEDVEMKHRRRVLVSKLSGGQKKRVSIALELLAKPSVFFLDEPTSGLDPGLDRKMMYLLRKLADKGHTIVLVTHATNNINSCDYVCFLAQGGRLAYFGPPSEAKKFFNKDDFAEIYTVLESQDTDSTIPEEAEARFKASQDYKKYVTEPLKQGPVGRTSALQQSTQVKPPKRGNPWKQFFLLSMRYLELLKNDKGYFITLLLQAPVIGLILMLFIYFGISPNGFDPNNVVQCPTTAQVITASGFPDIPSPSNPAKSMKCNDVKNFLKNNPRGQAYAAKRGGELQALQDFVVTGLGDAPKLLFIMAFAAVLFGCVNAAREIVKEANIYRRERTVNLGIMPYMFSKIVVLGILCLAQSFVLVAMVHIVDNFHQGIFSSAFLEVYITLALSSLAGLMVGLTVSAIAPNNDRAMSLIPIILIPQVIFSGALFPLKGWFIQLLGMLFPIRWAMAALGTSVGLHSDKLGGDKLFGDNYTYHGLLFSIYSQTDATSYLLLMWFALTVMIVILSCMTAYFLKRKDKRT